MKSNFFDYIQNQNLTFKEKAFTDADAVILSTIANLDLSPEYKSLENKYVTLGSLAKEFLKRTEIKNTPEYKTMELIARSKRYSEMLVSDIESEIDINCEKQFGGIIFYPTKDLAYVGFAGTGTSVIGYKEDLNMSYMDIVPAQQEAVKYLNEVGDSLPEEIFVGGFSKGGNLAVFASAFSDPKVREKIKRVFNHDGPGFSELIINEDKYKSIIPYVTSYIPKASIVGLTLNREEDFHVIDSTAPPIAQHQPYSWVFEDDDLSIIEDLSRTSTFMLRFQDHLLDQLPKDSRKDMIEMAFDILMEIEPDDFQNFVKKKKKIAPTIKKTWKEADKKTKKNVLKLFKVLGSSAIKSIDSKEKKKKKKKHKKKG